MSLDGEYLGKAPIGHFGFPVERGYTDLGRVRVTVERLGREDRLESTPGPG